MIEWDAILRKGYLPEVLPPVFSTKRFADFVRSRNQTSYIGKMTKQSRTRPVEYNATKRFNQRRTFGMLHPESFHDISLFISIHWKEIEEHFSKSGYSCSKPKPGLVNDRAVGITSHRDLATSIFKAMSPFRYVVQSDISRFYPTIYTHTIPWSFHGKDKAKADTKTKSPQNHFNKLDALIRQSQDGQSIGLPVGPDTSRIIAEIVAIAVDDLFAAHYPKQEVALLRHVDDIWIGASSMDEAEAYLYTYRECLREFELDINELKTKIFESSRSPEPVWPLSLKLLIKNEFRRLNDEDKTKCLSEIFRLAHEEKDDGIIKYAIRRFDKERLWDHNWSILEDFLVRCLTNFPHSIDYVARVVAWSQRNGRGLQMNKWNTVLIRTLERNSLLGNDSEVCWILWLMRELKIRTPTTIWDTVASRCGVFPIVMLAHLNSVTLRKSPRRQRILMQRLEGDPFLGPQWLLAHEASLNNWITDGSLSKIQRSEFMSELLAAKVGFFDSNATPGFVSYDAGGDESLDDYAIEDMSGRYDDDDDDHNSYDDDDEYNNYEDDNE